MTSELPFIFRLPLRHAGRAWRWSIWTSLILLALFLLVRPLQAVEERFPPPEFRSGYVIPQQPAAMPRADFLQWLDVAILFAALLTAAWIVHRRRSRLLMLALTCFSILYFGFYRQGCVCAVGSLQNVALGLFDPAYRLPWTIALFFALPLLFALFAGRVFCAGVCPLGALQDAVLFRPLQVPPWLETSLGLLAHLYLGLGVLLAATGSEFVICAYDPFIGFYHRGGTVTMLLLGAGFLLASMFIGRMYCRFLCPYGVLLRLISPWSQWKVHISPTACIDCRLCETACPFGALARPARPAAHEPSNPSRQIVRRLLAASLGILLLAGLGAWSGWHLRGVLGPLDRTIRLARLVAQQDAHPDAPVTTLPEEVQAWRDLGESPDALYHRAAAIERKLGIGGSLLGLWMALAIGGRFLRWTLPRGQKSYDADAAGCVACARCFAHCPVERERRGDIAPPALQPAPPQEVPA